MLGWDRPILGDVLVIAGTFFFAMSNVGEEFCVKKKDRVEVIAMIGLFGMLVSVCKMYPLVVNVLILYYGRILYMPCPCAFKIFGILATFSFPQLSFRALLERKSLASAKWSAEVILAFAGYATASFTFYSIVPFVLKLSGATLFNLSILTSDMWAVVIRIFFYKQQVDWLYYVAFALVFVGLIIYSRSEKNPTASIEEGDHHEQECRLLDEENTDSRNETVPSS